MVMSNKRGKECLVWLYFNMASGFVARDPKSQLKKVTLDSSKMSHTNPNDKGTCIH